MIDLSHLTEEEQAKILRVLQRDAELRKMEETRICQLQISNEIQRKNMTGEWFYKAKARRHKDTLHGAELIAASMRRKKPKTIYERLQMKEAKENSNSFSKNAAGDIFIPPELSLFLEEPKNSAVSQKENATQWQQQMAKKNPPSLGKQRENPFNKSFSSTDYPNEQERLPLSIGKQSTSVTSMQESLSHPKDNVSRLYFPTNEHSPAENNSETRPVPKPRTISSKLQVPSDNLSDASGSKNWNGLYNNSSTPKSILKRSPSSSSNDSEILRIGVQDSRNKVPASQTIPEGVTELNEAMANEESLASNNLEKLKQVRFSTNVDEKRISQIQEHYDANELSKIGEDSILDTDYMEEMDEEDTAGVDIMEENETLPEDSGFSDLRHLPLELQTDFMHLNQEVNSMSNTDFQSIQATDSNPQNYSDSYLPHSSSSKLTNQIHELDTGEMPMEKKSSRRSNSPSNSSYYSIDEQIPHTDFASSWVSDQQLPEIIEGGSRVAEKNVISQEKLNNFDLPYSAIQSNPNTDVSFQEQISPIKSDEGPMYNEGSEINLDENKEGFESQDEFGPRLNLPSGITRSSTFKKSDGDSDELPIDILRSKNPHDVEQEANNMFSSHSVENNQLNVQTRGSLSDDEITHVVRRRNPQTKDTYKSLEDLNSIDSMPSTLDSKNKEVVLSADDVSNIPVSPENTPLHLKKLKRLSQSVPALAENGDTDSMSERSYQMNKHGTITGSLTNISSSPGMTSRSSVSGSIMSIYSNEFGNIDVRGKIQFSLDYVDKLKEFHIFVVRCSDLAAADEKKNRSDPYVKSYLLPDKVKLGKKKTTVKKKTLSPVYNEILRYKVEKNVLLAQTLNLSVWHNDTFGRNNFLGEVDIELEKWDWSNKQMEWYNLKPRTITSYTSDNKGTLRVAFRYIPQGHKGKKTGEVQIWVKEATNLPQIRAHRLDPFVKCFILPDTTRKSRQKTRVVKKSRNPNFNHTMVYDGFEPEDLKDACVELSVWDHDKLVNHFLGGIRIGLGTGKSYGLAVDWMDSTEEEKQVWNKMITHPNIWVENVLPLRMLMLSKSTTN
ncbi:synaptotagmin-like protein 2 isoform X4 [Hypanus sabinus]|uniref:synaptotagmin-like protein 2 isoform X4 n=1 Tax=Hypanus sabinus TaxID=79690 RepID=UPI0028C40FDE|nr:synaptotagmin-like protein 2 isoform X4 [Hypanus sabinus]